jgi:hypothetical protein
MDWWRARTRGQKVGIVVGAVFALGIIGAMFDGDQGEPAVVAAADTTTTVVPSTTTSTTPPTTTTTTVATTTTTTPTTTTTVSIETQQIVIAALMEAQRDDLIEIIEQVFPIETVDAFIPEAGLLKMSISTSFASLQSDPEERSNDAWVVVRLLGAYYQGYLEDTEIKDPAAFPALELTMNGRWVIGCPGDFMYQVASRRAGQADMNATCSGLN